MPSIFEDVLVFCAQYDNWTRALAYASSLAAPGRARVAVLTQAANAPDYVGVNLRDTMVFCRAALPDAIAFHAAWADVLVIDDAAAKTHLEAIVLDGGRPCVVLPRERAPIARPRRIAACWNGSIESVRALKTALPLLRAADHVVLFDAGTRVHDGCSAAPSAESYLAEHGVVAVHVNSTGRPETAGQRIVELAADHEADLLVLGAYRHRRFSEWDGGVAVGQVLQSSGIPVLLAH